MRAVLASVFFVCQALPPGSGSHEDPRRQAGDVPAASVVPMKRRAPSPAESDRPWECALAMHASESPVRTPAPCPRGFSVSADVGWNVGAADADLVDGAVPSAEISPTVPFANELPTPTQLWGSPLKSSAALRLLELERVNAEPD